MSLCVCRVRVLLVVWGGTSTGGRRHRSRVFHRERESPVFMCVIRRASPRDHFQPIIEDALYVVLLAVRAHLPRLP